MSVRTYRAPVAPRRVEQRENFDCFGGVCTLIVADAERPAEAAAAVAVARRALLDWHERFSRFKPDSEITRMNRDPRVRIPASPMLRRLIEAALDASRETGGLVDATLGAEIERAGYRHSFEGGGVPLELALRLAPLRGPAAPNPSSAAARMAVDHVSGTIQRPRGVVFDPGGIAKGVFADEVARMLSGFEAYVVDCAGDIRWGGEAALSRDVHVASPFRDQKLYTFRLAQGAVATSGIGKRSWLDADGRPAHHLLDPRSGRPAFTGLVQATALATTAAEAEIRAKAALLSGPDRAARWLPHGGLLVREDGSYDVVGPAEAGPADAARASAPASGPDSRSASQPSVSARTSSRSGSLKISWNKPG
jgi:thiamine biosynthesis lipoprotein